ncbi:MAG: BlaI/MecI/CopY family transcriptional regulator [Flavobacteriales bacterium]|nr:BlaI/MecI/CopY family transcriptional regulator [Flavobacteriales bacterium]
MERLTKAEEQVMQALWKLGKGFAKEVRAALPRPHPAITTVSTVIRILEQKGFVGHTAFGKSHLYHPVIAREQYRARMMDKVVKDYFDGSLHGLVSAFVERNKVDVRELDNILKLLNARKQR